MEYSLHRTPRSDSVQRLQPATAESTSISVAAIPISKVSAWANRTKGHYGLPDFGHRHIPIDRTNWGPRLGFAYQLAQNTVLRGGVGALLRTVLPPQTFSTPATSFRKDATIHFTLDGGVDPVCDHSAIPSQRCPRIRSHNHRARLTGSSRIGFLATTTIFRQLEITTPRFYQWNFGLQHLFPFGVVLSADYSANRSTHLPGAGPRATVTSSRENPPSNWWLS